MRKLMRNFDRCPTIGSKVMACPNRYSCLARPDLLINEYGFHIHYMGKGIWKLKKKFDRDPTVGLKVMALTNCYSCLARPDLLLTEYRFHIHNMEKGIRKLL
jgi:hypothetical protein